MSNNICYLKILLCFSIMVYGICMLSCKSKPIGVLKSAETISSTMTKGDTMRGKFIYMADAANFTFCISGDKIPVAMEAAYIEAERAYTSSDHKDMQSLYILFIGLVEDRDNGEGNFTPHVIINKLLSSDINGKCE